MKHRCPFSALEPNLADLPLVVVDIGYSRARSSCGVRHAESGGNHPVGPAVQKAAAALNELAAGGAAVALVLEATLSPELVAGVPPVPVFSVNEPPAAAR